MTRGDRNLQLYPPVLAVPTKIVEFHKVLRIEPGDARFRDYWKEVFSALCNRNQERFWDSKWHTKINPVGLFQQVCLWITCLWSSLPPLSQKRSHGGSKRPPDHVGLTSPATLCLLSWNTQELEEASLEINIYTEPIVTRCPRANYSFWETQRWLKELTNKEEIICNLLFTHNQSVPRGKKIVLQLTASHVLFWSSKSIHKWRGSWRQTFWKKKMFACVWLKEGRTFYKTKDMAKKVEWSRVPPTKGEAVTDSCRILTLCHTLRQALDKLWPWILTSNLGGTFYFQPHFRWGNWGPKRWRFWAKDIWSA